ncbi:MAG: hypothetical protein H7X77_00445 [Anaerolineae bacterium]|nr:hypothetical protein [Anaerolineae bacterium]
MKRTLLILLTLILLIIPAVQPLLRGQLPWTADGTLHLYRLIALDHALSDGTLWARYTPGLVYGYGAPFFNYYSPLSLYPLLALHKLGLVPVQAWLWGMAGYMLIAAVGAYLLGSVWGASLPPNPLSIKWRGGANARRSLGDIAGLVTAAAYVYAPYSLFDALWRGTVSEYAALALLPYVLWTLTRLARSGHWRDWLLTVIAFTLFVPMHNVVTLHGAALIGVYALFLWWINSNRSLMQGVIILSPLVVGMMLTAFFWLPALTETSYVKLDAITATLPEIDVTRNLTDLSSVFALPITADPTQMQPPLAIALSWTQIALAGAAVVLVKWQKGRSNTAPLRAFVFLCVGLIALLVFMNTRASAVIWETVPLIRYSQFPWRLVGLASLLLALLAGIGVSLLLERIQSRTCQLAIAGIALATVIVYGYPYLYPLYLPEVNPQTIVDSQNFERESGYVATSSFGEYLPVWNFEAPDANRLVERFQQSEIIARLEAVEGVTVHEATWGHTWGSLRLEAEQETTLTFDWFYFPGWQATLDGQPLEIAPTEGVGLLQVMLPPGEHRLEIWLGNTDRQNLAWSISGLGVILLLIGGFVVRGLTPPPSPVNGEGVKPVDRLDESEVETMKYISDSHWRTAGLVTVITFILLKVLVIDTDNTFIKSERFVDGISAGIQVTHEVNFANTIKLLGYDLPVEQGISGETIPLAFYWQLAGAEIETDYAVVVTLRSAYGNSYNSQVNILPGGLATRHWEPGYYIQDRVDLSIPHGTPPGSYTLEVSLYDPQTNRSLDIMNAAGNPEGVTTEFQTITILPPLKPVAPQKVPVEVLLNYNFLPNIELIGLNRLSETAAVGQEFELNWVWHAAPEGGGNSLKLDMKLQWRQNDRTMGETIMPIKAIEGVMGLGHGETLRGIHQLYVPGSLETGEYQVWVSYLGTQSFEIGTMTIIAPERNFELPEMQYQSEATWQNEIGLAGYNIAEDGTLTLYWQTERPLYQSLNVFVHVVNDEEIIVEQSAGIPANYTRPTTGWAVDEVITDTVSVKYPSDAGLEVRVGWFDPITGERVKLKNGDEFVILTK